MGERLSWANMDARLGSMVKVLPEVDNLTQVEDEGDRNWREVRGSKRTWPSSTVRDGVTAKGVDKAMEDGAPEVGNRAPEVGDRATEVRIRAATELDDSATEVGEPDSVRSETKVARGVAVRGQAGQSALTAGMPATSTADANSSSITSNTTANKTSAAANQRSAKVSLLLKNERCKGMKCESSNGATSSSLGAVSWLPREFGCREHGGRRQVEQAAMLPELSRCKCMEAHSPASQKSKAQRRIVKRTRESRSNASTESALEARRQYEESVWLLAEAAELAREADDDRRLASLSKSQVRYC